jgi:hypothetical protein
MEDYVWALAELDAGRLLRRLPVRISYLRRGASRELAHTRMVFALAHRRGLPVRWLGLRSACWRWLVLAATGREADQRRLLGERIWGRLTWRSLPGWQTAP